MPPLTGRQCTMAQGGVSWWMPPKGASTVAEPMVESKRSTSPWREQPLRSRANFSNSSEKLPMIALRSSLGVSITAFIRFLAPFLLRKSRARSTTVCPCQRITRRGLFVTSATTVASRFSWAESARKAGTSFSSTTTAMRSWDSLMASSVALSPWYFTGTLSKLICRPSANSPIATDTPPAPKSLQRLMRREASGF